MADIFKDDPLGIMSSGKKDIFADDPLGLMGKASISAPEEKPGILGRVNESLVKRGVNIADELNPPQAESLGETLRNAPGRAFRVTGQAAGFIGDVGGEAIRSAYTTLMPEKAQTAISGAISNAVNSPETRPFVEGVSSSVNKFKKENPQLYKNIAAGINIGTAALGSKPAQSLSLSAKEAVETGAGRVIKSLAKTPERLDKELKASIREGVEKSIRPGVEGKRTYGQSEKFYQNAQNAVENIVINKNNLKLTDEAGEVIEGLPKNLKQWSQAVEQTKGEIFKEYDSMAKAAGQAGAKVDARTAIPELEKLASNKALQDFSPDTVNYAKSRIKSLTESGIYTAEEAQDSVRVMNQSLEAFYKSPTYDTASKAYIDAIIANHMRKGLDTSIESLKGAGYQKLKSAYGSLKAIERDVNRRAIVDARKNAKGLIDFTDIFSGSTAVHGILTLNPALVGEAAAAKGIAKLYRHLNDPNRIVKNMFEKTEKILIKKGALNNRPLTEVIKGTERNAQKQAELAATRQAIEADLGTSAPIAVKAALSSENTNY